MSELVNCRLCGCEPDALPSGNDVVFSCENEKCPMHGYEFAFSVWQALMGQGEAAEPFCWIVVTDTGYVRYWSRNRVQAEKFADENGVTLTALYTHPAPAVDDGRMLYTHPACRCSEDCSFYKECAKRRAQEAGEAAIEKEHSV